jgi:SAM-dependent methyltransferase
MPEFYTKWMSPGTASITYSLYGHLGLLRPADMDDSVRVLETHCGDSRAAGGLLPQSGIVYTAVDFSEGMLTAARRNLGDLATVVCTDSTKLPFADGSFDRYLSNLGVCCTHDLTAKLAEARRVLAPGGIAAMSMRIGGGDGDTSFSLVGKALSPFGLPKGPDREGLRLGKDLPALRARIKSAGFRSAVAWRTFATLPVHDVEAFMVFATSQAPIHKFLEGLDESTRSAAEDSLRANAKAALECGAIQVAVAVVVARC